MIPEPALSLSRVPVCPKKFSYCCSLILVIATMDGITSETIPETSDTEVAVLEVSVVSTASFPELSFADCFKCVVSSSSCSFTFAVCVVLLPVSLPTA